MVFRVSSPATVALAPGAPGHKTDGLSRQKGEGLERATGIEPVSLAWKAVAIMQISFFSYRHLPTEQLEFCRLIVGSEFMERAAGIEPASPAWKAGVLPLHNARSAPHCLSDGCSRVKQDLDARKCAHGSPRHETGPTVAPVLCLDGLLVVYTWAARRLHASFLATRPVANSRGSDRCRRAGEYGKARPVPPSGSAIIATGSPSTTTCRGSPAQRPPS